MRRYIALIHEGRNEFGVSFPDFPGCIAVERTMDAAVSAAADALRFHVEGMVADGLSIPKPRRLSQVRSDPEFAEDIDTAVVALVPLLPPRGRPQRLNISLDANLVAALDRRAKRWGSTRSGLIAESVRLLLDADAQADEGGGGRKRATQRGSRSRRSLM